LPVYTSHWNFPHLMQREPSLNPVAEHFSLIQPMLPHALQW